MKRYGHEKRLKTYLFMVLRELVCLVRPFSCPEPGPEPTQMARAGMGESGW